MARAIEPLGQIATEGAVPPPTERLDTVAGLTHFFRHPAGTEFLSEGGGNVRRTSTQRQEFL
ncbi:hypothetical protein [Actinoplanes sp. N902-109]|uniref:hypothetical protein n=1 Tax=Actinoplanes sp. (strain N902-109) TaxID=649831 RepID=UPI0012FB43DE|nr:hypothetical protein [Actinoplanes sp. N902-109]